MTSVLFVGTGAADWPPAYLADAKTAACGQFRGNASLLLDGSVLVDCGGTVPEALRLFGVRSGGVTDLLVTHTHSDHFDPESLARLLAVRGDGDPLRVWLAADAVDQVPSMPGLELHPLTVGVTVEVAGMAVLPLPANHVVESGGQPLHFLFERDGWSLLYATDGAWLLRPTWTILRQRRLSMVIWDATNGETTGDWRIFEHNSVDMVRLMMQTLRREAVVDAATRVYLTHLARTLCAPHVEMSERLAAEGLQVAHDGLQVYLEGHQAAD